MNGLSALLAALLSTASADDEATVTRTLAARFHAVRFDRSSDYARRRLLLQKTVAEGVLRERLRREVPVREADLERQVEEERRFASAKRWRLENVFKRFPDGATAADRAALRDELESLRRRALAGESFGALARAHSDSETRLLDGSLGSVTLQELPPDVAATVERLAPGDLSPILEGRSGLTLLRCVQILGGESAVAVDVLRARAADRLRKRGFAALWEQTTACLLRELRPAYRAAALFDEADDAVAISFAGRTGLAPVTASDVRALIQAEGAAVPGQEDPPDVVVDRLERHAALEGRFVEAARRGLLDEPAARETLARATLALEARIALERTAEARVAEPSVQELRSVWEARRATLRRRASRRVDLVEVPIERGARASFYEEVRRLGLEAEAGRLSLEELLRALGPAARLRDRGWLDDAGLFALGPNAESAVRSAGANGTTRAVQEGRSLLVLRVRGLRPERPLTYEEAAPALREELLEVRRRAARDAIRREILAAAAAETAP